MNKTAICTISSANYFPFSKTMLQSAANIHPDCDLFYLLADAPHNSIFAETIFNTIKLEDLEIDKLAQMAFVYDIVELNTAVKPFLLTYLLKKGYKKVIYIDPDIYLYNRLDYVLDILDTHSIALTPHSLHPNQAVDSFFSEVKWEKNMHVTGIFNLGFIAISDRPDTYEFLNWWQNRCSYLCFIEPTNGIFVDQKWAELAIAFYKDVFVIRDPGYNVSIWNLHERAIHNNIINGSCKLVFYHFSSIDMDNDIYLSKHDNRINFTHHPELKELFNNYRKAVSENGYDNYKLIRYTYGYYANGEKINLIERRSFARVAEYFKNPFAASRKEFCKNIRHYSKLLKKRDRSFVYFLISIISFCLYKIIGSENYVKLIYFLRKGGELRAHTFLVR